MSNKFLPGLCRRHRQPGRQLPMGAAGQGPAAGVGHGGALPTARRSARCARRHLCRGELISQAFNDVRIICRTSATCPWVTCCLRHGGTCTNRDCLVQPPAGAEGCPCRAFPPSCIADSKHRSTARECVAMTVILLPYQARGGTHSVFASRTSGGHDERAPVAGPLALSTRLLKSEH